MSEIDRTYNFNDLIIRYLSGNASSKEVSILEDWVQSSKEHKAQFVAQKKAWILAGMDKNPADINVDEAWLETSERLFEVEAKEIKLPKRQSKSVGRWMSIAATLAALIAVAIWTLNRDTTSTGALVYQAQDAALNQTLSDGSTVSINQYSTLAFDAHAEGNFRQAQLEGDAYFDVQRDASRPFRIQTPTVAVEVLGTSFYVDAREEQEEVQVIVNSGQVAVSMNAERVVLQADEVAIYNKVTRQLRKQQNQDSNFLAWRTRTLTFDNNTLTEVIFALNRQFHSEIRLSNDLIGDCRISATYKDKSLEAVMRIIEKTLDLKFEQDSEGKIVLSGEACN